MRLFVKENLQRSVFGVGKSFQSGNVFCTGIPHGVIPKIRLGIQRGGESGRFAPGTAPAPETVGTVGDPGFCSGKNAPAAGVKDICFSVDLSRRRIPAVRNVRHAFIAGFGIEKRLSRKIPEEGRRKALESLFRSLHMARLVNKKIQ